MSDPHNEFEAAIAKHTNYNNHYTQLAFNDAEKMAKRFADEIIALGSPASDDKAEVEGRVEAAWDSDFHFSGTRDRDLILAEYCHVQDMALFFIAKARQQADLTANDIARAACGLGVQS